MAVDGALEVALPVPSGHFQRRPNPPRCAADLRLVSAMPLAASRRWLGMEGSTPMSRVTFDRRVERGDGTVLAQWRAETVYRYWVPLVLDPLTGSSASGRGPTQWARSAARGPGDSTGEGLGEGAGAPLNWWRVLRNADEVHARANDAAALTP